MAGKAPTKSEILQSIAATTELSRKQVGGVVRRPGGPDRQERGQEGAGDVRDPGPAEDRGGQQARHAGSQGDQPLHQAGADVQGQAVRRVVKIRALKALKDMAK